jgi:uncharacterized membrane protein YphA (DoxX/SURF4 family)
MPDTIVNNQLVLITIAVYARWIVGGTLLAAGVTKARDAGRFIETIHLFRLLPRSSAGAAAYLIIGLEFVLGACLLLGIGLSWASAGASILIGLFALAILVNLIRHNLVQCNCFGPYFRTQISGKTLLRNMVLLALSGFVWQAGVGYLTLDSWLSGRAEPYSGSLGAFVLLTATVLLVAIGAASIRTILKSFQLSPREKAHE